jgi:hypothetical protein
MIAGWRAGRLTAPATAPPQVFDVSENPPHRVLPQLWANLKRQAGDALAQHTLSRVRILAAGGDGTVAWIMKTIHDLRLQPAPAIAIMPLGTGAPPPGPPQADQPGLAAGLGPTWRRARQSQSRGRADAPAAPLRARRQRPGAHLQLGRALLQVLDQGLQQHLRHAEAGEARGLCCTAHRGRQRPGSRRPRLAGPRRRPRWPLRCRSRRRRSRTPRWRTSTAGWCGSACRTWRCWARSRTRCEWCTTRALLQQRLLQQRRHRRQRRSSSPARWSWSRRRRERARRRRQQRRRSPRRPPWRRPPAARRRARPQQQRRRQQMRTPRPPCGERRRRRRRRQRRPSSRRPRVRLCRNQQQRRRRRRPALAPAPAGRCWRACSGTTCRWAWTPRRRTASTGCARRGPS